jgi:uroporphyrin-3 C-methyltransferase
VEETTDKKKPTVDAEAASPDVKNETSVDEAPAAEAGEPTASEEAESPPAPAPDEGGTSDTRPVRPASRQADRPASARGLLVLALLLALGALALAGWIYLQQASRETQQQALESRVSMELERTSAVAADARKAIDDARKSIDDAVLATQRNSTELRDLIADERSRMARELAQQREALDSLEASFASQRRQFLEMRSTDRVDWSLAEAEYLLRLAYQRLLMAEDVASAVALLGNADAILRELDDTDLLPAREAIARDLAALRAVPDVDVEGTWLRLQALAERVDSLLLFELSIDGQTTEEVAEDAGWQERLRQGFRAALDKIASFIVIRRREQPYETLIDPQWEQLVRQNLRMQISQAQAALLSGNPRLYDASLTTIRRWLREFFDFNQADVSALNTELDALMEVEITRDYPDIGRSLSAVKQVLDARAVTGGG